MAINVIRKGGIGPKGDQRITSLAAATALTVPAGANMVVLQAETQNVRVVFDGSTPTATKGMILKTTDEPLVFEGDLSQIKAIETAASAALTATYFAA